MRDARGERAVPDRAGGGAALTDPEAFLRRVYRASSDLDFDLLEELATPDIVIDVSRRVLNPAVYEGHAGVRRWAEDMAEVWGRFEFRVGEVVDVNGRLLHRVEVALTGRGSGLEMTLLAWHVTQLRDGRVATVLVFDDRDDALAAARA